MKLSNADFTAAKRVEYIAATFNTLYFNRGEPNSLFDFSEPGVILMDFIDYDQYAEEYDQRYTTDECLEENEVIKNRFLSLPCDLEKARILDIGSGSGFLLDLVGKHISHSLYTGVDVSVEMTMLAAKKYPHSLFIHNAAEKTIREIATPHDIVVTLFSIPYFGADAMEDIYSLLKVGGICFACYYQAPYVNKSSIYSGKEAYYKENVAPRVQQCIKRAEGLFNAVYNTPLTESEAYNIALFQKRR